MSVSYLMHGSHSGHLNQNMRCRTFCLPFFGLVFYHLSYSTKP